MNATLCATTCPHGTERCTQLTGHIGPHKALGDMYPGYNRDKSACTWEVTS